MRATGGITGFRFSALRGSQDVPMSAAQAVAAYVLGHKQEAANAPLQVKIVLLSALNIGAALHGCRTEYVKAALVLLKDEEFRLPNLVKIADELGGREQVKAIAFGVTDPHLRAICWRGMTAVERRPNESTVGAVAPGPRAIVGGRLFPVGLGSADQKVTQLLNIISTIVKNEQDSSGIVNKQAA